MKTIEQIKTELKDALPVHFHKGDPEPHLTHLNYFALEDLHADALAYIQRLESQVPRWIPVEERLPEKYQRVLGTCCMGVFEAVYNGKYWRIAEFPPKATITHWMPLPEAPEEDAHE